MDLSKQKQTEAKKLNVTMQYLIMSDLMAVGYSENDAYIIAQKGAQEIGLSCVADIIIFGGNRGGGKANTYATLVATPSGFRKMGELEVGDLICTPYNGVQKVSNIFEQGENTVYVFHFDDGTSITCMDNHRFWARTNSSDDFREMTAREIMDNYVIDRPYPLSLRRNKTDFVEIPLCGEVELNEKKTAIDLPLHPFILGYISGSGFWHFDKIGVALESDYFLCNKFRAMGYFTNFENGSQLYIIVLLDKVEPSPKKPIAKHQFPVAIE